MTTRFALALLLLGVISSCGDEDPTGGAGVAGVPMATGGSSGAGGGSVDDRLGELPCALVTPEPDQPPTRECEDGCTPVFGAPGFGSVIFFVACAADESLESRAVTPDALVCMTSPVDGIGYLVASPLWAQAVAHVCWIPCSVSGPSDPAFREWLANDVTYGTGLHIDFEIWERRCGEVWDL